MGTSDTGQTRFGKERRGDLEELAGGTYGGDSFGMAACPPCLMYERVVCGWESAYDAVRPGQAGKKQHDLKQPPVTPITCPCGSVPTTFLTFLLDLDKLARKARIEAFRIIKVEMSNLKHAALRVKVNLAQCGILRHEMG